MKKHILTLILFLLFISCFSQNPRNEYNGRFITPVKNEKLNEVQFINELTPELWPKLGLTMKERLTLDSLRKIEYPLGYYLYPQGGYDMFIDYVAVEISAICNGKVLTAISTSDKLTIEQKNILNVAEIGSEVIIKIKFKYKDRIKNLADNKAIAGQLTVTIVPEIEAEYPGGMKQLTEYLLENVMNKIFEKNSSEKTRQTIIKFTVNEQGGIVDAMIIGTPADQKENKLLLLDAISKMPTWKAAQNSKGIKVKQEFTIQFGGGC